MTPKVEELVATPDARLRELEPKALDAARLALNVSAHPDFGATYDLSAAICAYLAARSVPEGWKLVPVEPTLEWIEAIDLKRHGVPSHVSGCSCAECIIWAALHGAPAPASPPGADNAQVAPAGWKRLVKNLPSIIEDHVCGGTDTRPVVDVDGLVSALTENILASVGDLDLTETINAEWQKLVEVDDRTSPEEYPDMALITHDELASAMLAAAQVAPTEPPPNGSREQLGDAMPPTLDQLYQDVCECFGALPYGTPAKERLRDLLAAPQVAPAEPAEGEAEYTPTIIRNESAGFYEFVTEDVPALYGGMMAANVERIGRLKGGDLIGFRIYDTGPVDREAATREAVEAVGELERLAKVIRHADISGDKLGATESMLAKMTIEKALRALAQQAKPQQEKT